MALFGGELTVGLDLLSTSIRVVHPEACPDIGPICLVRDEPPQLHDQQFYLLELRILGSYVVLDGLAAELELPFRISHTTTQFSTLSGSPFVPDYQNIHHRNETLAGPTDAVVGVRGSSEIFGFVGTLKAAVGLPFGRTEPNPFALGERGLPHQHVQFGSGSFGPIFQVGLTRRLEEANLSAYGRFQLFLYDNRHGYRQGNRYALGLSAESEIVADLSALLSVDLINEQPERWDDQILQDGNLGRTDILVGIGVTHRFDDLAVSLGLKVPVHQGIISVGEEHDQIDLPALVTLGAVWRTKLTDH